jgi:hypothetical protein
MTLNFEDLKNVPAEPIVNFIADNLNGMICKKFGEPMTDITFAAVKNHITEFFADTQKIKIDKQYIIDRQESTFDKFLKDFPDEDFKIFFDAICEFDTNCFIAESA